MFLSNIFSRAFNKKHPLTRHTFFSTINRITSYIIYRLPIENKLKKRVVIFYLKLLFEHIEKLIEGCITNLETFDIGELEKLYLKTLDEVEEEAIKSGVPNVFVEKFKEWDAVHVSILLDGINRVANSSFYATNYLKMSTALDQLTTLIIWQMLDVEKTINSLNGDLERAIKGTIFDTN